jgi:hypothetical protein
LLGLLGRWWQHQRPFACTFSRQCGTKVVLKNFKIVAVSRVEKNAQKNIFPSQGRTWFAVK